MPHQLSFSHFHAVFCTPIILRNFYIKNIVYNECEPSLFEKSHSFEKVIHIPNEDREGGSEDLNSSLKLRFPSIEVS